MPSAPATCSLLAVPLLLAMVRVSLNSQRRCHMPAKRWPHSVRKRLQQRRGAHPRNRRHPVVAARPGRAESSSDSHQRYPLVPTRIELNLAVSGIDCAGQYGWTALSACPAFGPSEQLLQQPQERRSPCSHHLSRARSAPAKWRFPDPLFVGRKGQRHPALPALAWGNERRSGSCLQAVANVSGRARRYRSDQTGRAAKTSGQTRGVVADAPAAKP